jgi:hypothetical protein
MRRRARSGDTILSDPREAVVRQGTEHESAFIPTDRSKSLSKRSAGEPRRLLQQWIGGLQRRPAGKNAVFVYPVGTPNIF